jgi:putative FmdB family regulatory protein
MPTYDYECPKGHRFEVFQRMTDEPGADCPECGAPGKRKISGGAGFLFKGEGFYITDSRSDDYKKKASQEAASSSDKPAKSKDDGASKGKSKASDGSSGGGGGKTSSSDS